jgi:hypothetical protein
LSPRAGACHAIGQEDEAMRALLLLFITLLGCAPTRPPAAPQVVGRLLVYRGGRPVGLLGSGSPLNSTLYPQASLTAVVARNLDSRHSFRIPITDERGWFSAALPPGAYELGLDHYLWSLDTPARFQVPAGARCYLGTLGVGLATRSPAPGPLHLAEDRFALLDQPSAAQRFAGSVLSACPIRLLTK